MRKFLIIFWTVYEIVVIFSFAFQKINLNSFLLFTIIAIGGITAQKLSKKQ